MRAFRFGDHPRHLADLWLPVGPRGSAVVVLIHGGYWRREYDRSLQHAVVTDLVEAGHPVWNLDYRPAADGGWPGTFADVATAMDLFADAAAEHDLATDAVTVVGHSAGGTLALWAAARHRLPAGSPGAHPVVRPVRAISQAGVNDLVAGAAADLGGGAVHDLMGGSPEQVEDDRYDRASPAALLPLGVEQVIVTGDRDTTVPVGQSRDYAAAAERAGDPVRLVEVPDEGHFEHLEPGSGCWQVVRDSL